MHTSLLFPSYLITHSADNVYIGDLNNNCVRKITVATGIISTIAGVNSAGYSGDGGKATAAKLYGPSGVAVDGTGNVYIAEQFSHCIRKVATGTDIISTIAGKCGVGGYGGDSGQATAALIKRPIGISLDSNSNVYFGDYDSYNVIRKVTVATGIISTVAGTGSTSGGYDGENLQATSTNFNSPTDVVIDSYGNLYICDYSNNRVRKVTASTGLVSTIVGNGTAASSGDGKAATSAAVISPVFSRFDSSGNLYISENLSSRVRKVVVVSSDAPTPSPRYELISTLLKSLANYSPIASVQLRRLLQHCLRLNQVKCHRFNRQQYMLLLSARVWSQV